MSRYGIALDALDRYRVVVELPSDVCRTHEPATWTIGGEPHRIRFRHDGPGSVPCHARARVQGEGKHVIAVGARAAAHVAVDDRLVAAVGDPLGASALRCGGRRPGSIEHAVRLLAAGVRRISLTYLSRACGRAASTSLRAQAQRLRGPVERDHLDAVVVRLGAAHLHLDALMRRCASSAECPAASVRSRGGTSVRSFVDARLATLPRRLHVFASALERAGVPARAVVVAPFADPTLGPSGRPCLRGAGGLSPAELRWIGDVLIRSLNLELAAEARRHGWVFARDLETAFGHNGPCAARGDRLIRLGEGGLEPNAPGRLALAARLAPVVSGVLGLARENDEEAEKGWLEDLGDDVDAEARKVARWYAAQSLTAQAVMALLAVLALALLLRFTSKGLVERTHYLVQPGAAQPDAGRSPPGSPALRLPKSWLELALHGLAGAASVLVSAAFVTVVGAAILWVRFWSARIPPDEAVAVVPQTEFIVVGAGALVFYGLLAVAAVVLVWRIDGKGDAVRATRRGLALLIVVEMVMPIVAEGFPPRQAVTLLAAVALVAWLLHFMVDRAIGWNLGIPTGQQLAKHGKRLIRHDDEELKSGPGLAFAAGALMVATMLAGGLLAWRLDHAERLWGIALAIAGVAGLFALWRKGVAATVTTIVRAAPVIVLAGALWWATQADEWDRWFLPVFFVAAALLFVSRRGIAGDTQNSTHPHLEPPRIALAIAGVTCVMILVARDERWLAGAAVIAILLAGFCLLVAQSSESFLPYGLAVLLSIPIFGAGVSVLRAWESPQMQPVATIAKDFKRSTCGLFVAEGDDRLYLARVDLDELGGIRRPRARRGRIVWVRRDELAATSVGPLQPIGRAVDQALTLRRGLLLAAGVKHPNREAGTSCEATGPAPQVHRSRWWRMARRFQPQLVLDRRDRFWPVAVRTVFAMQDRQRRVCRRIDGDDQNICIRVTTQADLPWMGGQNESLEYPSANDVDSQYLGLVDALGSIDPQRSSMLYFLQSGGQSATEPVSLQYWSFYTYNRQRLPGGATAGRHEGDFESVGVLLSSRTHRPRYVWMARHDDEGRMFTWNEPVLRRTGDHVTVFSAFGSHASYENCDRQARQQAPLGIIDDRPTCDAARQLRLPPESTPITDLARVSWGCWQGLFGHRAGDRVYEQLPYFEANGPRSPLWQQEFGGVTAHPCDGIAPPPSRQGQTEEVLPRSFSRRIRTRAGRLDPLVDECEDWTNPPARGTYLVACDPLALRRYVNSGLEDAGAAAVHIDDGDASQPVMGQLDIPAVRRQQNGRDFRTWRIASAEDTVIEVFASCRIGGALVSARFDRVKLHAGQALWLDDTDDVWWRLRTPAGEAVGRTRPRVVAGDPPGSDRRCTG